MKKPNRVYASIDRSAVSYNIKAIEQMLSPQTQILAVVKTDAYGHGAAEIAAIAEAFERVFGFAVATAEEALFLREQGIKKPILILGYAFEEDYEALIRHAVRLTVYSYEMAEQIAKAAQKTGMQAQIHIKIDTGMSRIGFQATDMSVEEIARIHALSGLAIEGIFTHFARADEVDLSASKEQLALFLRMCDKLKARGIRIRMRHCANSAGIVQLPEAGLDLVRAGIILYGLYPSADVGAASVSLRPVMELKSRIVHIKTLERGRSVSYGGTYRLQEEKRIATIPVGYGDGYPRSLSNRGYVLIHGKKAPILGRVCMDQFMADVTDIPEADLFDTVTLLGKDGAHCITMEELGALSGRFNYEFACCIGRRVPRIFF